MTKAVRSGSPLKGNLTADWFNRVSRELTSQEPTRNGLNVYTQAVPTYLNEANTVTINQFEPVSVSGTLFTPENDPNDTVKQFINVSAKKPASGVQLTNFGIAQQPIQGTFIGNVVFQGLTWAYIERTDSNHKFVKIDTTSYTLKSCEHITKAYIVSFTATSGNFGYALLDLNTDHGGYDVFETDTIDWLDVSPNHGATWTKLNNSAANAHGDNGTGFEIVSGRLQSAQKGLFHVIIKYWFYLPNGSGGYITFAANEKCQWWIYSACDHSINSGGFEFRGVRCFFPYTHPVGTAFSYLMCDTDSSFVSYKVGSNTEILLPVLAVQKLLANGNNAGATRDAQVDYLEGFAKVYVNKVF